MTSFEQNFDPVKCLLSSVGGKKHTLIAPSTPITRGDDMATLTAGYFEKSRLLNLPAPVCIPANKPTFLRACADVFISERKIHGELYSYRALLQGDRASRFDQLLVQHPAPRNLLLRMTAAQDGSQRMIAGIYLGSTRTDKTLGDELHNSVNHAFLTTGSNGGSALRQLCETWGNAQATARTMIVEATWRNLVGRKDWPVPEGFIKNMSCLLEHEFPLSLREVPANQRNETTPKRLQDDDLDAFQIWFSEVELLHETRMENGGRINSSKLHRGNPKDKRREEGLITGVTLTPQQALDDWSKYISIPSLQHIEIAIRRLRSPYDKLPVERSELRLDQMIALGQSPLAPFISRITEDASQATVQDAQSMRKACIAFLTSLAECTLWRSSAREQSVRLVFTDPKQEVADWLLAKFYKPTELGAASLNRARIDRGRFGAHSVVIPATVR